MLECGFKHTLNHHCWGQYRVHTGTKDERSKLEDDEMWL